MALSKYDEELRKTELWRLLHKRWLNLRTRHGIAVFSEEFADFLAFYEWAMSERFTKSHKVMRKDPDLPFSRENYYLVLVGSGESAHYSREVQALMRKWDKSVARIRKHYGLPPLEKQEEENDG